MRASPFFIFYVFVLLAVTLRWNWRGALGCAGMLIFMLLILSWKAAPNFRQLIGHPDFELNATVMRLIFLFVAGGTLAFFGAIREQNPRPTRQALRVAGAYRSYFGRR